MNLNNKKTLLIAGLAITLLVIFGGPFIQQAIYPQTGLYAITVVGSNSLPINGAQITILDPAGSGEWLNMGQTNQYGQLTLSGWQGITAKATYGTTSNTGVFPDQPQSLTITLAVPGTQPPTTPPPVQTYSFTLNVNPIREAGIVGVQGGGYDLALDSYPAGTVLTLTANRIDPYEFSNFVVNGQVKTERVIQITINSATTVTANFRDTSPTATPTPTQQVNIEVDDPTPVTGQTVHITVSTNPPLVGAQCVLHAYVNGAEVAFNGVESTVTASNGMAILSAAPAVGKVDWKVTVNGATSNTVSTQTSSTNTPTVSPTPTKGPTPNIDLPLPLIISLSLTAVVVTALALKYRSRK